MKAFINQFKKIHPLIYLALFLSTGWFYWFQFRPSKIKTFCAEHAKTVYNKQWKNSDKDSDGMMSSDFVRELNAQLKDVYSQCLHEKGL